MNIPSLLCVVVMSTVLTVDYKEQTLLDKTLPGGRRLIVTRQAHRAPPLSDDEKAKIAKKFGFAVKVLPATHVHHYSFALLDPDGGRKVVWAPKSHSVLESDEPSIGFFDVLDATVEADALIVVFAYPQYTYAQIVRTGPDGSAREALASEDALIFRKETGLHQVRRAEIGGSIAQNDMTLRLTAQTWREHHIEDFRFRLVREGDRYRWIKDEATTRPATQPHE